MRVCLDTNILAYAEGVNTEDERTLAISVVTRLPRDTVVPVQVLGELFNVLTRKAGRTPHEARTALLGWQDAFTMVDTSPEVISIAVDLAADHGIGIWDAVIVSAASTAGCRLLLSEDLQDGFTWAGVTITNPFASTRHPLLEGLLEDPAP